jgi:hypothetical protein
MPSHDRTVPRRARLAGLVLVGSAVSVAALALPLVAQPRPAIPERACAEVRLELVPRADGARGMGLRVVNVDPGDFDAHMHRDVHVEREVNGRWEPVTLEGLWLRAHCDGSTTEPVRIERDSSLTLVPWDGMQGDTQCGCERCVPAPAGRYRFYVVAWECFRPLVTYSAPFTLAAP